MVCYDLKKTEFKVEFNRFVFYFSSDIMQKKFESNIKEFCESEKFKIQGRFNIEVELNDYFSIVYYSKLEKRGFRVYDKIREGEILCLKDIKLNGELLTNLS